MVLDNDFDNYVEMARSMLRADPVLWDRFSDEQRDLAKEWNLEVDVSSPSVSLVLARPLIGFAPTRPSSRIPQSSPTSIDAGRSTATRPLGFACLSSVSFFRRSLRPV
jgi:hypothetical protein